jgi:hypothetical protein
MPRFGPKPLPAEIANTSSLLINNGIGDGWIAAPLTDYVLTASYVPAIVTTDGIQGNGTVGSPVQLQPSISITSVTASLNGNGSQITNITSSNITNFTTDVRNKISGSQYVSYATGTGVVSLPYTGSILGTTPLILGQTITSLSGIADITCSHLVADGVITAAITETGVFVQTPSAVQQLTASSTIIPNAGVLKVSSSGNINLSSTPTVQTAGVAQGTRVLICNIGTHSITFRRQDGINSALQLSSATVTINQYGTIELILINDGVNSYWYEISYK